jgi:hypothetical protein
MHSRFRTKGVLLAALVAFLATAMLPALASAEPQPGAKKKGFRLFARSLGAMTINRIYCGLSTAGQVCVDSTNSSTIGGGFWPKGTADQYVFNSGLQVAGIIGPDGGTWANDTVGGFLFDPKGLTEHGEEVRPLYNATSADDIANWPDEACVPSEDAKDVVPDFNGSLFHPLLQSDAGKGTANIPDCRKSASQGDIWFVSWEGNYSARAGRKHPLGVTVETRGLGWNFPAGNEDILYFIYTFYNTTTTDEAAYIANGVRGSMAKLLAKKAQDFHTQLAANGITGVPTSGYTINNLFAAFAADMDVSQSDGNYSTVFFPFALGNTYEHTFQGAAGWTFDASIFGAPFFPGAGFVGVKYLKSPTGPGEINLFSNTVRSATGVAVGDPNDVVQLYRYLSGTQSIAAGDRPCQYNPSTDRICYVNTAGPLDMRFFQSSTPLQLAPGEGGSIVVAYIMAAPVATATCPGTTCDVTPGAPGNTDGNGEGPLMSTSVGTIAAKGVNRVDTIMGYVGFNDANGNNIPEQSEFTVVPGSLLGKSLTAQAVFDAKFLLPFAPSSPDFFLIPGDNKVSVMWKPSPSESTGDPYYAVASQATVFDPNVGANVANFLYDPNYRNLDVEGYRIYRGRVDAPNELQLLAQFDYSGTVISDYTGIVNPNDDCAPEYGILTNCPAAFPNGGNQKDGTTLTAHVDYDLNGQIIQLNAGSGRVWLQSGQAYVAKADTVITGRGKVGSCGPRSACPQLSNTGVPFVFIDKSVRNSFRYFYSVTAFDVNSIESGPTSLESPRVTIPVTPVKPASNAILVGDLQNKMIGRGVWMDSVFAADPVLDPAVGTFSGPQRPANGANIAFAGEFISQVVGQSGAVRAVLDSLKLGQVDLSTCCGGSDPTGGKPVRYYWRVFTAVDSFNFVYALQQDLAGDQSASGFFTALTTDDALAKRYGGDGTYTIKGSHNVTLTTSGNTGDWGLAWALGEPGFENNDYNYNGYRWFDGPSGPADDPTTKNETEPNPNKGAIPGCGSGSCSWEAAGPYPSFNTGGKLTGVATINLPMSYHHMNREWRNMAETMSGGLRAADFNLYWGAGGKIDSVIDVTHNVVVPFQSTNINAGWGVLNTADQGAGSFDNRTGVLTPLDWTCVEPFRSSQGGLGFYPCTSGAGFVLRDSVIPGAIAFGAGNQQSTTQPLSSRNPANLAANAGFSIYVSGTITLFELTGGQVPADGTVWALRTYAGYIRGGRGGIAGDLGNYTFTGAVRPFSVVGGEIAAQYTAINDIAPKVSAKSLKQVHTVPDPYYVTNEFEQSTDNKVIKFVNLPEKAVVRIYSSSGVLVNVLEHSSGTFGGELTWNVRNRNNQIVASGVYFYHIEAPQGDNNSRRVGKMTIVNFAQ